MYSLKSGVEQAVLGLYIIRGDNMCVGGGGGGRGEKHTLKPRKKTSQLVLSDSPLPRRVVHRLRFS